LDNEVPISDIRPLDQIAGEPAAPRRFIMVLLGFFAALALVLSGVGIYGVMAYSVSQRTHEIGIRMALGAQQSEILKRVIGQGLVPVLLGMGAGLAGAVGLSRFLSSLLFQVQPTDPVTFAVVPLGLFVVALLACFIPARRAAKVDPMVALRYE
jgi:putative ABC transport system permease protein